MCPPYIVLDLRTQRSMRGDPSSLKLGVQPVSLPYNRVLGNCALSGCHLWECFPHALSFQPCLASWEHSTAALLLFPLQKAGIWHDEVQIHLPCSVGSTRYERESGWRLPGHLDGNPALSFEASPRCYGKALSSSSGSDASSPSMIDSVA